MQLPFDGSFEGFRRVGRLAALHGLSPGAVQFVDESRGQRGFFVESLPERGGELRAPRAFLELGRAVAAHASGAQWDLLYRVLHRLTHGEPGLLQKAIDADVRALHLLEKGVTRDVHKMHSFLRFRRVEDAEGLTWAAFYEPDHRILAQSVPFFVSRFGSEPFVVVTPHASATWNCSELSFGPGLPSKDQAFSRFFQDAAREDEFVDLFRTYYSHMFNPARENERAMRREMPVRFWKHMPETQAVPGLLIAARERTGRMLAEGVPAEPAPRAENLAELALHAARCTACPIHQNATQTVFGKGPSGAKIVLLGEQPGDEEDRRGEPFVGPAGQVLRQILQKVGVPVNDVYLTNAVKHFGWEAKGKRRLHKKPRYSEVVSCRKWLEAELELLRPRVIVCLGLTAAQSLLGPGFKLAQARGKFIPQPWADALITTYHPSAILRMRDEDAEKARRQLEDDLTRARDAAA
jgi:probable DNA metabolism protein